MLRAVSSVQVGGLAESKPSRAVSPVAIHFTAFCVQIRGQFDCMTGVEDTATEPQFGEDSRHRLRPATRDAGLAPTVVTEPARLLSSAVQLLMPEESAGLS